MLGFDKLTGELNNKKTLLNLICFVGVYLKAGLIL